MNHHFQIIETPRLILRPFTLDDIDAAYQMNLDEAVSRYTGDGGVLSRAEVEKRIVENVLGDYKKYGFGRMAVLLKDENVFIGFAGLKYLDDLDEVDLGYRSSSEYWGKGYATEAAMACLEFGFGELNLNRIIAMAIAENKASTRVLEKLGFCFERNVMEGDEMVQLWHLDKSQYK